jgi:hypothetical protein
VLRLLVTANVVPSSPIVVTLLILAIFSTETSVLTKATPCTITENGILHCQRRENIKFDKVYVLGIFTNVSEESTDSLFRMVKTGSSK